MIRKLTFPLLAALAMLAAAVLATWPLAAQLDSHLIGHPFGDTTEYLRHIWALGQALLAGRDPFFQPDLLYPAGLDGAWLWSLPLQSFPQVVLQFVMPLTAAHNLTALGILTLNGLTMACFVRWLLRHEVRFAATGRAVDAAALLAGVSFTIAPSVMGQLGIGHTGVISLYPAVGFLWALLRLIAPRPRTRRALAGEIALTGALFAASLWGSLTLLVYVTAPLAVFALIRAYQARALLRWAAACIVGGLFTLPFVLPALGAAERAGDGFTSEGAVTFSADLLAVVSPSFNNPLYANFTYNRAVLGIDPFEGAAYLGILPMLLGILALFRVKQARLWALMIALVWLFSLGPLLKVLGNLVSVTLDGYPGYVSLPHALLSQLPGLDIARTPARFNLAVSIGMAVVLAYGACVALTWLSRRQTRLVGPATALLLLAIGLDLRWFAAFPMIPADIPLAVTALSDHDERARAVFNVPWDHPLVDKEAMYLQTEHTLPLIGGHIARQTPLNPAKGALLQGTLQADLLHEAGVDVIILHRNWDDDAGALEAALRARFGQPYHEDEALLIFRVPAYSGPAAGFVALSQIPERLTNTGDLYFYAPAPGGALFSADVRALPSPSTLVLSLDGVVLGSFPINGAAQVTLWVPFEAGYHTLTAALEAPCAGAPFDGLACAALELTNITFAPPEAAP
ncbi:MAG: hypothetical protein KME04_19095 [Pleurocapsa minor GSE-CHR-MK-17-07R]|jgi:hypothetical protein|nr:hypothetical protein [Pleurocapsa minor GSE-CHR-MK 17-07R]